MEFLNTKIFLNQWSEFPTNDHKRERDQTVNALSGIQKLINQTLQPVTLYKGKNKKVMLTREPKGTILIIPPKTTPFLGIVFLTAIAAAVNNRVFLRPPTSYLQFAERFVTAINKDLPKKNVELLKMDGERAIDYAVENDFDMVMFMGSYVVGKTIHSKCAMNGIEYSGNHDGFASAIILNSVLNVEKILKKIEESATYKNGLDCDATKCVFIPKSLVTKEENWSFKIKKYTRLDDVLLELSNNDFAGLSVSVWGPVEDAIKVSKKLKVGRVTINSNTHEINPLLPWGGIKKSSNSGGMHFWTERFTNQKLIEIYSRF